MSKPRQRCRRCKRFEGFGGFDAAGLCPDCAELERGPGRRLMAYHRRLALEAQERRP